MSTRPRPDEAIAAELRDELAFVWPQVPFDLGAAFGPSGLTLAATWHDGPLRRQVGELLRRRSSRVHLTRSPSVVTMAWCLAQTGNSREASELHNRTPFDDVAPSAGPLYCPTSARQSGELMVWSRSRQLADLALAATCGESVLRTDVRWSTVAAAAALTQNDPAWLLEAATVLARECPRDGRGTIETLRYAVMAARLL